jgi:hypothetical protein
MELILEQIDLKENKLNDNTFDVFYDFNTKRFHAFENDVEEGVMRERVQKIFFIKSYILFMQKNFGLVVVMKSLFLLYQLCLFLILNNGSMFWSIGRVNKVF